MQNSAPTLQLRDIHLPVEPGFWPLAPGWWALLVMVLIIVYFVIKQWIKVRKRRRLNDLMQAQLTQLIKDYDKHQNKHQLAASLSQLLKRFCLHVLKDSDATALTGQAWIDHLNKQLGSDDFNAHHDVLVLAQYQSDCDYDVPSITAVIRNYFPKAIKSHLANDKEKSNA